MSAVLPVHHTAEIPNVGSEDRACRTLIAAEAGSRLSLQRFDLAAGADWLPGVDEHADRLVFVLAGAPDPLREGDATVWPAGESPVALRAAGEPASLLVFGAGHGCDEHAALGPRGPARYDGRLSDAATGDRSFQVLLGPENDCCRATMFIGAVPPGAAPWHYHLYDEIVYTLAGGGAYHQAGGRQATRPGCAVRIPPRTVHINENGGEAPMLVLGVFTPAGSPSAAYLAADPTERR